MGQLAMYFLTLIEGNIEILGLCLTSVLRSLMVPSLLTPQESITILQRCCKENPQILQLIC